MHAERVAAGDPRQRIAELHAIGHKLVGTVQVCLRRSLVAIPRDLHARVVDQPAADAALQRTRDRPVAQQRRGARTIEHFAVVLLVHVAQHQMLSGERVVRAREQQILILIRGRGRRSAQTVVADEEEVVFL